MNGILRQPVAALARWLGAGVIGALACSSGERADTRTGSLEAEWTGADTGKLSAPAVAEWCDGLKLLELRATHGDTGLAIVLYPADSTKVDSVPRPASKIKADFLLRGDSVTAGAYPVLPPDRADSSRPSAALALRWFAETSIRGFRGDSGTVVVEAVGPGASAGRFAAHLRSTTEGSKLSITGSFKGLSVTKAPEGCVGRPPPDPEDTAGLSEPDESDDAGAPAETAE